MGSKKVSTKKAPMPRSNTRIFEHQMEFIKAEAHRSKGQYSEGDIHRQLLDEAITNRKKK